MLKRRFIITELVVQRGWPSINTGAGKRLRRAKKKDGTTTMLSNDWVGQTRICILNFVGGVQLRYLGSTYHPGTTVTGKSLSRPRLLLPASLAFQDHPAASARTSGPMAFMLRWQRYSRHLKTTFLSADVDENDHNVTICMCSAQIIFHKRANWIPSAYQEIETLSPTTLWYTN